MAPAVRLLGQQSPIVYSLANRPADGASTTYHTALVKTSDEKNSVSNAWARLSNSVPGRGEISNTPCSSQLGPADG